MEMSRAGVPLLVIQRQLGHADLAITSVYLRGIDNTEIVHPVHERPEPVIAASHGLWVASGRCACSVSSTGHDLFGEAIVESARRVTGGFRWKREGAAAVQVALAHLVRGLRGHVRSTRSSDARPVGLCGCPLAPRRW